MHAICHSLHLIIKHYKMWETNHVQLSDATPPIVVILEAVVAQRIRVIYIYPTEYVIYNVCYESLSHEAYDYRSNYYKNRNIMLYDDTTKYIMLP